jgi:hypothetical protein
MDSGKRSKKATAMMAPAEKPKNKVQLVAQSERQGPPIMVAGPQPTQ